MNRKVFQIINSVESIGVWHECLDIKESSVSEILADYGIFEDLTDAEAHIILEHLLNKAEKAEIQEAVRWANSEDEILQIIPERVW